MATAILFRALVLGYVRNNRLRSTVTLVAVALGVGIALAIDLANATAIASFASSVNVVANHVNLQVLGIGNGFDERALLRIEDVPGVEYAAPVIENSIVVGGSPRRPLAGEILRVLGVDLLQPLPAEGNGPALRAAFGAIESAGLDPYELIAGRAAFVSRRVARRYRLRVGGLLPGLAGGTPVRWRVAGILPANAPGIDSSVVFVDIATAQETFGEVGRLDRIDIVVDPKRLASVHRALAAVIPPGARTVEPRVRTAEIERMLRSFRLNLAALSYVALLVGLYLIYNAVAISVVQRKPEIGTLRGLGATRRQIFTIFLAEGAVFGAAGSLLGLAFGSALAQFAVPAVTQTVDVLYVPASGDRIVYEPSAFLQAFAVGTLLAAISALAPAVEAAGTAPALSMRAGGFEGLGRGRGVRMGWTGCALLAAAGGLCFIPAVDGIPLAGYFAGLLIVFGSSLCLPFTIASLCAASKAFRVRRLPAARLGMSNFGSSLRRNSVAVAALMVAVGMTVSVAVLIASFRATVAVWARQTIAADLFVQPLGAVGASEDARFPPVVASKIRRVPGVGGVDGLRAVTIPYQGTLTNLVAVEFSTLARRHNLPFLGHVDARRLERTLPGSFGALASEPFSVRFGIRVGDEVPVATPSGPARFRVAAIYNDYSSDSGVLMIDEGTYARLFRDRTFNSLSVYARSGVPLSILRSRVVRSVLPLRIDVETSRELRAVVLAIFDRTFAITNALYVISISIAVLGVVSTLFALVLERRREIGTLRYLGLSARGVRRMVYWEAACIGALGGVAGIAMGGALALLLIDVINRQAFGWLITLRVPTGALLGIVALVVVAALLAGIYPARMAARISTTDAVRVE